MTAATLTLTDFLLARIAEDEAVARSSERRMCERLTPERLLAECEAKRRIVDMHSHSSPVAGAPRRLRADAVATEVGVTGEPETRPCDTLRALAAIWSDHPDYDPDWS